MIDTNDAPTADDGVSLTPEQAHLVELLIAGVNIVGAARELKVHESTCRRWLKLPHVAVAYEAAKNDLFQQVLVGLQKQSLKTLQKHINADVEVTAGSQIRAVMVVNDLLFATGKMAEIEAKMIELEALLRQQGIR